MKWKHLVYFPKSSKCIEKIYENKLCLLNTCNHYCNLGKKNLLLLFLSWLTFAIPSFYCIILLFYKFCVYRIESLEEEIISKGVKLVIIDSVASVVRKEFDTQLQGNMRERNKFLAKEAASLKYLAEEFSIPVSFSFPLFLFFTFFFSFILHLLLYNIK